MGCILTKNSKSLYKSELDYELYRLLIELLKLYKKLEMNSLLEYKYYTHTEMDSNVTEFEGLSNSNKIVFKTKLESKYVPTIMKIFQSIYDDNPIIFDFNEEIYLMEETEYYSNEDIVKNLKKLDVNTWFEFMNLNIDNHIISDKGVDNEMIHTDIPKIEDHYYPKGFIKKQKIYTLDDIIKL
jgi:hypothetical protein